jgi:hypothetical protein
VENVINRYIYVNQPITNGFAKYITLLYSRNIGFTKTSVKGSPVHIAPACAGHAKDFSATIK